MMSCYNVPVGLLEGILEDYRSEHVALEEVVPLCMKNGAPKGNTYLVWGYKQRDSGESQIL